MTRVLVAATSAVVRAGLEAFLARSERLTVVSNASSRTTLAEEVEELEPDVVVLESEPHGEEHPLPLPAFPAGPTTPAVILLADEPDGEWTAAALRSGVRAVLPRGATADEIVAAVEAAASGLVVLHADLVGSLLPAATRSALRAAAPAHQALTPREIEVLGMLAEGVGNKTIAARLGISEHTVKFHVASIFTKLGASSRTEAVTIGARQGLIML